LSDSQTERGFYMITLMDASKKLIKITYYCVFCGEPVGPTVSPKQTLEHEKVCVVPNLERMAL